MLVTLIGERSEPPSDKLGGEICIATRALVCIYLYIIGERAKRAKRYSASEASHSLWCSMINRAIYYWASEASPTLGCSIEISRDIYMSVCMSVAEEDGHAS